MRACQTKEALERFISRTPDKKVAPREQHLSRRRIVSQHLHHLETGFVSRIFPFFNFQPA